MLRKRDSSCNAHGQRSLAGESCTRLWGTMRSGFGISKAAGAIAWIGNQTKRLKRVQLPFNWLSSTTVTNIGVTFGDFRASRNKTKRPRLQIERGRRPPTVKAHERRLTSP